MNSSKAVLRVIAMTAALAASPLAAQQPSAARAENRPSMRVPVTVALVETLPGGIRRFEIVRDPQARDVILLPENASNADLSAAVHTLFMTRLRSGDAASQSTRLRSNGPVPGRNIPWAGRVLRDLRHAPTRSLAGIGTARAVDIWLPATHRRQRASD